MFSLLEEYVWGILKPEQPKQGDYIMRIMETALYVDDLEKARQFYVEILGFEVVTEGAGRHLFLRVGDTLLLLFNPEVTSAREPESKIPSHGTYGSGHVGFEIDEQELDEWRTRLAARKVAIEETIHWDNGGISLYFRDPAGNILELLTKQLWNFPKGKN